MDLDKFSNLNSNFFHKDLNFLFNFFNSDKGEKFENQYQKPSKINKIKIDGHYYHKFYEKYFFKKKNDKMNILELGSFKGNAAAALYFYFKNSYIKSGDIFPDIFRYKSKRIENFLIDNSSEQELNEKILNRKDKFDIIIEDAGHYLKDQIISLFILFESLNSKGVFVIEELEFPDERMDMNPDNEKPTLRDILISIKEKKDFISKYVTKSQKEYFIKNFESINIYKGRLNEIAFILKK
tara:strand:+ start:1610 stop:2326 length:717 start_codon:yes stop_codon:yes gene_type:complete